MKNPVVLGVDIGGSHITAALVDLTTGTLIPGSRQRIHVNSDAPAGVILDNWCNVINAAFSTVNVSEKIIGIAMPGPFDYKEGISLIQDQDKFKTLYQVNIKAELASRLNISQDCIRFINDAAGFLQGEVFGGAAVGYDRAIGLTLGTGLGAAFCENGSAEDAALWNTVFKDGIAEDYLSTRWFVERYFELSGKRIEGVKELNLSACQEQPVQQIFEEFGNNLAQFIIELLEKKPVDVIVLGGNISNAQLCFMSYLMKKLDAASVDTEIKIAELKEDASLIGAASCWNALTDVPKQANL